MYFTWGYKKYLYSLTAIKVVGHNMYIFIYIFTCVHSDAQTAQGAVKLSFEYCMKKPNKPL